MRGAQPHAFEQIPVVRSRHPLHRRRAVRRRSTTVASAGLSTANRNSWPQTATPSRPCSSGRGCPTRPCAREVPPAVENRRAPHRSVPAAGESGRRARPPRIGDRWEVVSFPEVVSWRFASHYIALNCVKVDASCRRRILQAAAASFATPLRARRDWSLPDRPSPWRRRPRCSRSLRCALAPTSWST